jgi:Zn-dependent peptidase ImmA (M78 family)
MSFQPDYARAKSRAFKVLKENLIDLPPVNPVEIARNEIWPVKFATFPPQSSNVSGYCDFERREIVVNGNEPTNRQTFTIAHELGHALLHEDIFRQEPSRYKVLMRSPMGRTKDPLEQEANAFAANLLVPRFLLDKYAKVASVYELSRLFVVSEDVIRFRMLNEYK